MKCKKDGLYRLWKVGGYSTQDAVGYSVADCVFAVTKVTMDEGDSEHWVFTSYQIAGYESVKTRLVYTKSGFSLEEARNALASDLISIIIHDCNGWTLCKELNVPDINIYRHK